MIARLPLPNTILVAASRAAGRACANVALALRIPCCTRPASAVRTFRHASAISPFAHTDAELRVFLSIVEIGGVPDVARSMGLAETTIKTHLARTFAKTGTQRQADLVRLVAAFTPSIKV